MLIHIYRVWKKLNWKWGFNLYIYLERIKKQKGRNSNKLISQVQMVLSKFLINKVKLFQDLKISFVFVVSSTDA